LKVSDLAVPGVYELYPVYGDNLDYLGVLIDNNDSTLNKLKYTLTVDPAPVVFNAPDCLNKEWKNLSKSDSEFHSLSIDETKTISIPRQLVLDDAGVTLSELCTGDAIITLSEDTPDFIYLMPNED
jgi:hypothetical protein